MNLENEIIDNEDVTQNEVVEQQVYKSDTSSETIVLEEVKTIENSGNDNIVLQDSSLENSIINQISINIASEDDDEDDDENTTPCPVCKTLVVAGYGITLCPKCGHKLFRRNPKIEITQFLTIDDQSEEKKYKKILSHINNKLIDKKYELAFKYCLEAEEIAPSESTTWEYFVLVEYYKEVYKKEHRKSIEEIVKLIKTHLEKCKINGVEEERYEELVGIIANHLTFKVIKPNIGKFHTKDKKNRTYWSRYDLMAAYSFLRGYELSFSLYKDHIFLEEYVKELSKPYKWIVRTINNELINLGKIKFNAIVNRERIIKKIQAIKYDYSPPEIELERLEFIDEEDFNPDEIIIISIE